VEEAEQLASLKEIGCVQGQGYLFGRAVPASEAAKLLGEPRAVLVA
jgi:EAL domain-containing protein (putative c-di-GMP-specific phosphodiesterase class I)